MPGNWREPRFLLSLILVVLLLLPALCFIIQSDFVYYYHYATHKLGLVDRYKLRDKWSLPDDRSINPDRPSFFESESQREDFMSRLPHEIKTKHDLSAWMIASLESGSRRPSDWAVNIMHPAVVMNCLPKRAKILSLAKDYLRKRRKEQPDRALTQTQRSARREQERKVSYNTHTFVSFAKWATLAGLLMTVFLVLKKPGKRLPKPLMIALILVQAFLPGLLFAFLLFMGFLALGGGDTGGGADLPLAAIGSAKVVADLLIVALNTGWAFVMWRLVLRAKTPVPPFSALMRAGLLAVLINANLLMVF